MGFVSVRPYQFVFMMDMTHALHHVHNTSHCDTSHCAQDMIDTQISTKSENPTGRDVACSPGFRATWESGHDRHQGVVMAQRLS
jgi:hypothetical protein